MEVRSITRKLHAQVENIFAMLAAFLFASRISRAKEKSDEQRNSIDAG
jgi:hypothetical protein